MSSANGGHLLQLDPQTLIHIVDTVNARVYMKDSTGRFLWGNAETLKAHGLRFLDELIGRTDYDFFDKGHADSARSDEERILNTGEAILDAPESEIWSRSGLKTHVLTSKYPLLDDGRVVGTIGISKDLTTVRDSMDLLEQILDTLPQCVFFKDLEGRIQRCNKSFENWHRQLGIECVIGKNDHDLWPQDCDLAEGFIAGDRRVFATGQPYGPVIEEHRRFPDGRTRRIRTWKFPLRNELGIVVGLLGIYEDITPIWDTHIHDVARGIAHALRTRIGNLQDLCNELTDEYGATEPLKALKRGIMRISHVSRITDGLSSLTVPGGTSGRKNHWSRVDISQLLKALVAEIGDPRLVVKCDTVSNAPITAVADSFHLELAIEELIANAQRFTPEDGTIGMWLELEDSKCVINVRDSGSGISYSNASKIFESSWTSQKGLHTGLGLYYVRLVADMHCGKAFLRDTTGDGRGAHFIIEIPINDSGATHESS